MEICQSPHCTCPASPDSAFCSAGCAGGALGVVEPAECECQHETCTGGGRPDATNPAPRR